MSDCSGCYNGCFQITSDQCVKYTGPSIPELDIENGIPLSQLEEKITDYLLTVLDGSGIFPILDQNDLCTLVANFLPISGDISLNDVVSALIQAACSLQSQVNGLSNTITILNADYVIGCLTGVTASSDTHAIVQAVITKLCAINLAVIALQSALSQYVKISDLNTLIEQYLESVENSAFYNKMVPYTAVEYYGPLAGYPTLADGFTAEGVGYGAWINVYLCNGATPGVPDKRGRTPVGTNTMGCNPYASPVTDIATPGNPNYDLMDVDGENFTILSIAQLAPHLHGATSTVNDPGHKHLFGSDNFMSVYGGYTSYGIISTPDNESYDHKDWANPWVRHLYTKNIDGTNNPQRITWAGSNLTVSTVTSNMGNGSPHDNRPPLLACHYIIYIP